MGVETDGNRGQYAPTATERSKAVSRIDRNARPSRLTIADRNRQWLAARRAERELAEARRLRRRAAAAVAWAALAAGALVIAQTSGLLGGAL